MSERSVIEYFRCITYPTTVEEFVNICNQNNLVQCNKNNEEWKILFESTKERLYNVKAMDVLINDGTENFIEHVFTDQDNPTRQLSYAEMRMRYG